MKAITIYQPWASLIACGDKHYETRSWQTSYRGRIAIHAAKTKKYLEPTSREMAEALIDSEILFLTTDQKYLLFNTEIGFGAVIATADLTDCLLIAGRKDKILLSRHPDTLIEISEQEQLFGDYTLGRYAWQLENVRMQGLWEWKGGIE